jgi:hypothetical protein
VRGFQIIRIEFPTLYFGIYPVTFYQKGKLLPKSLSVI